LATRYIQNAEDPATMIKTIKIYDLKVLFLSVFLAMVMATGQKPILAYGGQGKDPSTTPGRVEKWNIRAVRLIFYHASHVVVGEGDVVVQGKGVRITGDRVAFNWDTGDAFARGGVVIYLDKDIIAGNSGRFNVRKGTGTLKEARLFLKRNQLHIQAARIEKKGVAEYVAKDATISTCAPPKQAWSFTCKHLTLDESGMAKAWGTRFRIRTIPVLYSPWISVPLNKYKKTGLLFPSFSGSTRNGFGVNVPLYLVLSDSVDMTLYQNPMASRGWMEGVELRYALSKKSKGVIRYNFLIDTKDDNDFNNDGFSRENNKRWWFRAKADQELPLGFHGMADIDLISDLDYLQEFDYGPMGYDKSDRQFERFFHRYLADDTDLIRPSFLQAQKETDQQFIGAQLRYNDQLIPKMQDTTIQTLPRITLKGLQKRVTSSLPIYLGYDASYVNYWREKGIREQRVFLNPVLYSPWRLFDSVDIVGRLQLTERFYRVEGGSSTSKNKLTGMAQLDASTTMERFYGGSHHTLRHVIRPRVTYSYRPYEDQEDLPSIDALDRLSPENRITYEVLSFLTQRSEDQEGVPSYHDLLRLKVQQSYEMEGKSLTPYVQEKGHHFSDIYLELELYLADVFLRYDSTFNVYGEGFTTYNLWAHGKAGPISSLDLAYRYNKTTRINELNLSIEGRISENLYGRYGIKKSFEKTKDLESLYGIRYQSGCWALETTLERNRDETRLTFQLQLLGLGKWSY